MQFGYNRNVIDVKDIKAMAKKLRETQLQIQSD